MQVLVRLAHLHDRTEKLKPVSNQVKPVLPPFDLLLVHVFGAEGSLHE